MLSNILKNNLLASIILVLLILSGSLALKIFNSDGVLFEKNWGLFYHLNLEKNYSKTIKITLSFLVCFSSALIQYFFLNKNEVLTKISFFPSFIYIIFSLEFFYFYELHSALISNLIFILSIQRIMSSYRLESAKGMLYDGAFLFSVGCLIYWPSIVMIPLIFLSLAVIRPFIWREWLLTITGLLTPPFFLLAIVYIFKDIGGIADFYPKIQFYFPNFKPDSFSKYFLLFSISFLLFFMVARRISVGTYSRKIRQKKNLNIIIFWLIFSSFSIFIDNPYNNSFPLLMIPPISALIGEWLGNFRKDYQSDFILILLITAEVMILFSV